MTPTPNAALTPCYPLIANPTPVPKDPTNRPLRFGILGAAKIGPAALIRPAISHPEVEVYAVAARDINKARAYARRYGIPKVHGSYEDLISDEEIDVIYNPLPNGLHFEWTMKALEKGKHVLLEKPAANTAEETKQMFELAEREGLVLLEAFHYRFHPAALRVKAILESGELGKVKHVDGSMTIYKGFLEPSDIRFDYALGGGALMDLGCYGLSCIRYFASCNALSSVLDVTHRLFQPANPPEGYVSNVDEATTASLALSHDVTAQITCDLREPLILGFIPPLPSCTITIECEGGKVEFYNFALPSMYHTITITPKDGRPVRKEKAYTFPGDGLKGAKGEPWWETYRYQLEAFVSKVRGREPHAWVGKEDSVANMEWIEEIYSKMGLGVRPKSSYVHPGSI